MNEIYDASGRNTKHYPTVQSFELERSFDGDGQQLKQSERTWNNQTSQWRLRNPIYFIRSSVLGGKMLTEVGGNGAKSKTYILASGKVIARQESSVAVPNKVVWEHWDAAQISQRTTDKDKVVGEIGIRSQRVELDPMNNNVDVICHTVNPERGQYSYNPFEYPANRTIYNSADCMMGGSFGPCESYFELSGPLFGIDSGLPFEASGTLPNNPNNPMAMAHNILNNHFRYSVFNSDTGSLSRGEYDMMNLPLFSYGRKNAAFLFGDDTGTNETDPFERGRRIFYIGDSENPANDESSRAKEIKSIWADLYSEKCTAAFLAAGLTPPVEQTKNTVIVTENRLTNGTDNWAPKGSKAPDEIRDVLKKHPKTNDVTARRFDTDGRAYIIVTNFTKTLEADHLEITLIHSFIHAGGQGKLPPPTFLGIPSNGSHDLTSMGKAYNDILKACTTIVPKRGYENEK